LDLSAGFDEVPLAVVGGLLGTGGVAAAAAGVSYRSIGGALTGQFGQPGKPENDTSEIVNLDAPDFPTDVTGVKGWIADDAACTWERSWRPMQIRVDAAPIQTDVTLNCPVALT
jgi:hypothetical protein